MQVQRMMVEIVEARGRELSRLAEVIVVSSDNEDVEVATSSTDWSEEPPD